MMPSNKLFTNWITRSVLGNKKSSLTSSVRTERSGVVFLCTDRVTRLVNSIIA